MKKIIPFKKDVIFKTNISEIISISLENTLQVKEQLLKGEFIISGEYKISDKSNTVDPFNLELPFSIIIDEKYDTSKASLDIDDFYYEIINDNVLRVAIDVLLDKLEEKIIIEEDFDLIDETPKREVIEERCIEEEIIPKEEPLKEKISSNISYSEEFVTYNVCIIREGDTLDKIIEKYNIDIDELNKYNDTSDLKLGDKLIIPNKYERD